MVERSKDARTGHRRPDEKNTTWFLKVSFRRNVSKENQAAGMNRSIIERLMETGHGGVALSSSNSVASYVPWKTAVAWRIRSIGMEE